jgi:hypothetical protein
MSLPISIDEKKIKIIKDYPMLTLVLVLMSVICYQFYDGKQDAKEYKEHLKQDLIDAKKAREKDEELLTLWRDLGRQATNLNKMSQQNDTSK